eukprot:1339342-Amorphochlora_amoeboformis.AAC.2
MDRKGLDDNEQRTEQGAEGGDGAVRNGGDNRSPGGGVGGGEDTKRTLTTTTANTGLETEISDPVEFKIETEELNGGERASKTATEDSKTDRKAILDAKIHSHMVETITRTRAAIRSVVSFRNQLECKEITSRLDRFSTLFEQYCAEYISIAEVIQVRFSRDPGELIVDAGMLIRQAAVFADMETSSAGTVNRLISLQRNLFQLLVQVGVIHSRITSLAEPSVEMKGLCTSLPTIDIHIHVCFENKRCM